MEMKKILIILLMGLLCCSAAACGKKENKDTKPSTNTDGCRRPYGEYWRYYPRKCRKHKGKY